MLFGFPIIGFTQTDDPYAIKCFRKNKHMKSLVEVPKSDISRFRIILAVILPELSLVKSKIGNPIKR
jgi:hypothetical protein